VSYETDLWPFIEAKHHGVKRTVKVRLVVIHTPIWREAPDGAEGLGRYFHDMEDSRVASATLGVDSDSIVQYVKDSVVAYAAPGANHDGVHIEIVGTHLQTKAQWRDYFSITALALAADATAQYCLKYDLPIVHLTDDQLARGLPGVVGHDQVSRVYKKSTHTDPGPNFPWIRFMAYAKGAFEDRK
jgi:N-acetyl-anhydromuramyl-L-alanine amidase AmpD